MDPGKACEIEQIISVANLIDFRGSRGVPGPTLVTFLDSDEENDFFQLVNISCEHMGIV